MPVTTAKTMDDYRKLIADVMAAAVRPDSTGPQVFENFGPGHAKAVIEAMLRIATKTVCIYAEKLSSDVYDAELLTGFLTRNPNGIVRILVDNDSVFSDQGSALFGLGSVLAPNFQVRLTNAQTGHVSVVDGRYARIEESQTDRKALVSFGNNSLCAGAQQLFDVLWSGGTPLTIGAPPITSGSAGV
jgi:hypothetical protein